MNSADVRAQLVYALRGTPAVLLVRAPADGQIPNPSSDTFLATVGERGPAPKSCSTLGEITPFFGVVEKLSGRNLDYPTLRAAKIEPVRSAERRIREPTVSV